ncbi:MAG: hypothetical protein V3574_04245 [Candidatus Moraniibacteriota bacterium]
MSLVDFFRKKKKALTDGAKTSLGNLAGEVKNTLKRANQAPDWLKKADQGLTNFSQKAENFPKFNFAEKIKNPVGRFAAEIPQFVMNIPSSTVSGSLKDYGKVKATPSYALKRGAEAANIGVDIGSMLGGGKLTKDLAVKGFKTLTKTGAKTGIMDVVKTGAKRGAKEGAIYGGVSGSLHGVQQGDNLKEQFKNAGKGGVSGTVIGATGGMVLGGLGAGSGVVARKTKDGVKKEAMNIADDIHRLKNPYKKRIVNETKEVPNGAIVDGQNVTMSVPTGKRYIQTIKDPFKPQSITGKILTIRPGLNVLDVNSTKPKIISSKPVKKSSGVMDFDKKIALKNKKAQETVNNQKINQKLNLNKTEEGFVSPKDVKAPEMKFKNSLSRNNYIAKQKYLEKQPKRTAGTAERKSIYKTEDDELNSNIKLYEYAIETAKKRIELKEKRGIKVKKSELEGINTMKRVVDKFKSELANKSKPAVNVENKAIISEVKPKAKFGKFTNLDLSGKNENPFMSATTDQFMRNKADIYGISYFTVDKMKDLNFSLKKYGHKGVDIGKDFKGIYSLDKVLDDPILYEKYPTLKNINVVFADFHTNEKRGMRKGDTIFINSKLYEKDPEKLRGTIVHEIQHAKQDIRGNFKDESDEIIRDAKGDFIKKYESQREVDARRKQAEYADFIKSQKTNPFIQPKKTPEAEFENLSQKAEKLHKDFWKKNPTQQATQENNTETSFLTPNEQSRLQELASIIQNKNDKLRGINSQDDLREIVQLKRYLRKNGVDVDLNSSKNDLLKLKSDIEANKTTGNPFLDPKKAKNSGMPPVKEVSPVIEPTPTIKPKVEENPIEKLSEYQKYKKETIDTFLKSEEGYKKIAEMEVKAEMQDPINKDILSGIRNNPIYRKERQIYDDMGEGFLLEKDGRFIVADAKKSREYEGQGWKRKIEIDSLASASGFDRGEDYLNHIIQAGENNQILISPRSIARKELLKDPAYLELEREIERLKPLAVKMKAEMPAEPKVSRVEDVPFIGDEFSKNPFIPEGGFNQYQQRAYQAKGDRIKKIGEVLNRGNELLRIGYRKNEINKKGIDEIKRIEKLSKLGYPKAEIDKMDFERMDLIINKEVPWTSLKDYYERKNALNTNFLRDIDPQNLKDINPLMTGWRDATRNFEVVFGKDYPKIKERLLDPFDNAKGRYIDEQKTLLDDLNKNIVQRFGITKGSKADKAIVDFGEGKIGLEELKLKFPKDWKNIVEADKWFRTQYSKLLGDLNMTREAFFPTHPLYPESTKIIPERKDYYRHGQNMEGFEGLMNMFENSSNIDPSLALSSEFTKPKTKWLSFGQRREGNANDLGAVEGYLDYLRKYAYAKNIDPYIQKFRGVDTEAKKELGNGAYMHETIGLAEELSKKMDPIQKIVETGDINKIKEILTASKVSESQADWMAKELLKLDDYQEVKKFIQNKTAKNKQNILENMGFKASADVSENKLNNFLKFVDEYANDLAGKTKSADRWLQNRVGRKILSVADFANKRFKANAVLGNLSSSLAQFFNLPQGVTSAGARNSIKGVGMTLADVFNKKSPINKSTFIKERYFRGYDDFDEGLLANTRNMASWITGIGDKIGTKFIWNAHYNKALNEGIDNPIKYADDWTRKMVAGRGIGEVPLDQKAKIIQMTMPFQLEVANMWYALKDIAGDNPQKLTLAKKMMEFTVASFVMNRIVKEVRGSDVSFDPFNAMIEAMNEYKEEEDKTTGAIKVGGRMVGEVVSNVPGGQSLAAIYPEYGWKIGAKDEATGERKKIPRKELFGEGDPTRFGTGGLPMFSAFKNPQNILTTLGTPFGGKQIEKTISGAKTLKDGYAESGSGQIMTPVDRDITNIMQGLMFGKNAMGEVRDYYNNEQKPLSDLQGEKFKMMGNDRDYFNSIKTDREANKEKEDLRKNKNVAKGGRIDDDIYQLSNGKYYVKSLDKDFPTQEKAQKELIKDEFKNSDQNFVDLGDTVLRKSEDGTVSEISKNKFNSMPYTAQLSLFKKSKDINNWLGVAEKQIEALNNSLSDPNIDELEKVEIQGKMETLLSEYQKYQGYGGFTKPKVAKALEDKFKYPLINKDFMKIKDRLSRLNFKRQVGGQRTFFIPKKRITKVSRRK